ncbi:zinc finger protein 189 [Bombina bombina]|uniref:zinc finger protein 189 n=1 Tax=Bombina bombina TaxID=8345 RepID=UPI00235AD9C3|nr:zinc finger protein 189 [Bombina bombina]
MFSVVIVKFPVSFDEVAVYFSEDEWQYLEDWQKDLYKEVMQDNLEAVLSLEDFFRVKEESDPDGFSVKPEPADEYEISNGTSCIEFDSTAYNILEKLSYICSECKEQVDSWSLLIAHKKLHLHARNQELDSSEMIPARQQIYNIQNFISPCNRIEQALYSQTLHQNMYPEQSLHSYVKCNRGFIGRSRLDAHINPHMNMTNLHSGLLRHPVAEVNGGPLIYAQSDKPYSHRSVPMEHQKNNVAGQFYSCKDCGKSFFKKSSLFFHQQTHTREKTFPHTNCVKNGSQRFKPAINLRERPCDSTIQAIYEPGFLYKPVLFNHEKQTDYRNTTSSRKFHSIPKNDSPKYANPLTVPPLSLLRSVCQESVSQSSPPFYVASPSPPLPLLPPLIIENQYIERVVKALPHLNNTIDNHEMNRQYRVTLDHNGEQVANPFKCGQCKRAFFHWSELVEHQKSHNELQNTCCKCNKSFIGRSTLPHHQKTYTIERPYSCMACGKRFSQRFRFLLHQRLHKEHGPYKCTECNKTFQYGAGLLRHQRCVLCVRKQIARGCPVDGLKKAPRPSPKNTYVNLPSRPPGILSSLCTSLFFGLSRREKRHPLLQNFQCSQCKQNFVEFAQLREHQRSHRERQMTKEYGKTFMRRNILSLHQRLQSEEKTSAYKECKKQSNLQNTELHQGSDGGDRPRTHIQCDKPFSYEDAWINSRINARSLKNPSCRSQILKIKHPPGRKATSDPLITKVSAGFSCPLVSKSRNLLSPPSSFIPVLPPPLIPIIMGSACFEGTTDSSWLKEDRLVDFVGKSSTNNQIPHISQTANTGDNQLKCYYCKKSFSHWIQFMEHQKTCPVAQCKHADCDKNVNNTSQLFPNQTSHRADKPYVCIKCNKRFSQKFSLFIHQRIHNREKPFKCIKCAKSFRYQSDLHNHNKYGLCL